MSQQATERVGLRQQDWRPFPGGQEAYLSCPVIEKLAAGNRGGGKTEIALVDFGRDIGRWGDVWRGIVFAKRYKQLDDVIAKAKRLYKRMFGNSCRFLASKSEYKFVWQTGEELLFRVGDSIDDYWEYHGQEFPFVHYEELTRWPNSEFYDAMKSCNRCSTPGVRRNYSSSTNPFGPGHAWVKERFVRFPDGSPIPDRHIIAETRTVTIKGKEHRIVSERVRIHVDLEDNAMLVANDPEYFAQLDGIANPNMRQAWRYGDWDIEAGGFLAGIWDKDKHIVDPFDIPDSWPRWRALDWGFNAPYSVGWYTIDHDGVIYRYREVYGWGGSANKGTRESVDEVAKKILKAEEKEAARGIRFKKNPADSSIFNALSIKNNQGEEITHGKLFRDAGVPWVPSKKGPGSRKVGAQVIIDLLKREQFKVFRTCKHWLRTVPILEPDEDDWDDVDSSMEDHCWDETMYSLKSRHSVPKVQDIKPKEPKPGSFEWLEKYGDNGYKQPTKSKYRR